MTKEQKCIAELWTLLARIEDGARSHDLSLLRVHRGASGCDAYQGLPPICRIECKYRCSKCGKLTYRDLSNDRKNMEVWANLHRDKEWRWKNDSQRA